MNTIKRNLPVLILSLVGLGYFLGVQSCGIAKDATDTAKTYAIEQGKQITQNVNTSIRDCTSITDFQTENDKLKAEIVEKDKKITWLRKKAKDAGADLTKF